MTYPKTIAISRNVVLGTLFLYWSLHFTGTKDRTRPGIRLDMMKNKTLLRKLPDQFKPFENVFGCQVTICNDLCILEI